MFIVRVVIYPKCNIIMSNEDDWLLKKCFVLSLLVDSYKSFLCVAQSTLYGIIIIIII